MGYIADKYDMPAVASEVRICLKSLPITIENVPQCYSVASKIGVSQCLKRCKELFRSSHSSPFVKFFGDYDPSSEDWCSVNGFPTMSEIMRKAFEQLSSKELMELLLD